MLVKPSSFVFKYFFLWLLVLIETASTNFIDQSEYEKEHIKNFTDSVILSNECKIRYDLEEPVYNQDYYFKKNLAFGINCDISSFQFNFKFDEKNECYEKKRNIYICFNMQLAFPKSRNLILGNWFQFDNLLKFVLCFKESWRIRFWNLKGFDLDMFEKSSRFISVPSNYIDYLSIELINFEFSFYSDGKLFKSCDDIVRQNSTKNITNMFQLFLYFDLVELFNVRQSKHRICPLFLQNSATTIRIYNLASTFYKNNVPKFDSQRLEELNTKVKYLDLSCSVDIDLDLNFLHPSVFKNIQYITINQGSLNTIAIGLFESLKYLQEIKIDPLSLRKLNHKSQGIEWIKSINRDIRVDLNDTKQMEDKFYNTKFIYFNCIKNDLLIAFVKLSEVLPDEDFCLYRDFPFHQMVVLMEGCDYYKIEKITEFEQTCTFLWLYKFLDFYRNLSLSNVFSSNLQYIFNDTIIYKMMNDCNFEQRLKLCNSSNYKVRDVWTASDYQHLNKIFEFTFRLATYIVSLFGMITNSFVIIVILHKINKDLFDGLKQYTYLCLNSIFSFSILFIQFISWFSDCFWPYQVFCPLTHNLVAFQFFKVIFQVIIVNALRFMCNFTYVMFAINRIALIGKDGYKVFEKISKWGVKKLLVIAFLFSLLLSGTKYFNYYINIDHPEADYPMREKISTTILGDIYKKDTFFEIIFLFSSLSDLLNHFVFLCIILLLDIFMLVKLRHTLAEKFAKFLSMNPNSKMVEKRKEENEDSVNKATRMVIVNSLMGIFLKLPLMILPIINIIAQIYYSNIRNVTYENIINPNQTYFAFFDRKFGYFYYIFQISEFPDLFDSLTDFLYSLSLAFSFFIYFNFDKKINAGSKRIFEKITQLTKPAQNNK